MIPFELKPEPKNFDQQVRSRGLAYLNARGIPLDQPLGGESVEPFWRECLPELHRAYGGICSYLCIYFEQVLGAGSVDHFIAKSTNAGLIYEWSNYRLACLRMNARKNKFDDVLDPFMVEWDWFRLELVTGKIYPNPNLSPPELSQVKETIKRLKLDDDDCREMRGRRFDEFIQKQVTSEFLRQKSPFIWYEANRQGLI